MSSNLPTVRRVRLRDLPTVRRMVYANMVGKDAAFTEMVSKPMSKFLLDVSMYPYLATNGIGFKYVDANHMLGCAYVHIRRTSGFVFNVNVNEDARRKGVGQALMQEIEALGRGRGLEWLLLQVDGPNEGARGFYERLDYRPFRPNHLVTHNLAAIFNTPYDPHIRLEPLSISEGQQFYTTCDTRERKEGDLWANDVVAREYAGRAAKTPGRSVRILYDHIEMGGAKLAGTSNHPVISLRLFEGAWAQPWLPALLRQLLDDYLIADQLTLHLGSSTHTTKVTPILNAHGFVNHANPKILMLKQLL